MASTPYLDNEIVTDESSVQLVAVHDELATVDVLWSVVAVMDLSQYLLVVGDGVSAWSWGNNTVHCSNNGYLVLVVVVMVVVVIVVAAAAEVVVVVVVVVVVAAATKVIVMVQ